MLLYEYVIYALIYFYVIYGFFHFVRTIVSYLKYFGLTDVEPEVNEHERLEVALDSIFEDRKILQMEN